MHAPQCPSGEAQKSGMHACVLTRMYPKQQSEPHTMHHTMHHTIQCTTLQRIHINL